MKVNRKQSLMKTKIWIALITIYIIWGSTYLGIRLVGESFPPFGGMGIRFLIAGAILFIWRRLVGDPAPTRDEWQGASITGFLLLIGGTGLLSWAEQTIPSGIAALLVASVPMWLVLLETFRHGGTKPTFQSLLGILIGFGGIVLLIGPAEFAQGKLEFDIIRIAGCLIGTVLWAIGSIYARTAKLPESTILSSGVEMLAGGAGLLVLSSLLGEWQGFNITNVSLLSALAMAYLIFVGSLLGFVSYAFLLKNAPVSLVATYAYVNPVVAIFLGNLIAQEALNTRMIIAASIIIGSVIVINTAKNSKAIQQDEISAIVD
jgi:drug/metabolite transporter (DMT)-like permease